MDNKNISEIGWFIIIIRAISNENNTSMTTT